MILARGILLSLCIALLLLASAFAANDGPPLTDTDTFMHDHSLKFYSAVGTYLENPGRFVSYPKLDLGYFKRRDRKLAHTLHNEAVDGEGVIKIGEHKSWLLGQKQMYYASIIRPDTDLGRKFQLDSIDNSSPAGKASYAFWRHKGQKIKLLRINTYTHTGANFEMHNLRDLIPLRKVREVV